MIELNNVSISFPVPGGEARHVLENISLKIGRGELVYLVGPTGSGKSSLLRSLYMEHPPQTGSIRIVDFSSSTMKRSEIPYLRRSLGVVFQDFQLLPDRNVFDNVAFAQFVTGNRGKSVKNRVIQVLSRVGLSHKRNQFPHELSGGEQQRVVIARAIINEPWIILADEPTGNLDPTVADQIQKLLIGLNRSGMTVLMATHDYRLVRNYPSRTLAVMNKRIVEVDPRSLSS
ncbi:MAG: ATP-binding cassette domain-containing protein [Bacteroidetes Order II. Incertae sedis bacterium]|nr:ATP-binding cassette domain-containing protein [Bacteroidetes Order II. bacterium]MDG1753485.1 ATP-binding cassette domain-containing protein [Rhodothermales bacterium]HAY35520.1 cell division ATP-binding protein FtsE [Bacteroidota bacterium]MBT4052232.1 ATP-binding cassette domain-containing protein [Bacteroidetes Order II. bacterium]MBT4603666.1 ATP-binding cassette domain-containing protein [Bacteroidetes Order II. bacterium]